MKSFGLKPVKEDVLVVVVVPLLDLVAVFTDYVESSALVLNPSIEMMDSALAPTSYPPI